MLLFLLFLLLQEEVEVLGRMPTSSQCLHSTDLAVCESFRAANILATALQHKKHRSEE